jgi:hypothetical protein
MSGNDSNIKYYHLIIILSRNHIIFFFSYTSNFEVKGGGGRSKALVSSHNAWEVVGTNLSTTHAFSFGRNE